MLIGGRPETLVAIQAIRDSPILGHGSYPVDPKYLELKQDIQYEHGYSDSDDPEDIVDPVIPTHSHLTMAWVESGILGGVCWIYIFALTFRAVLQLGALRPPLAPLYSYLLVWFLWDILYSPFGSVNRIWAAFFILLSYHLLQPSARALSVRRPTAKYLPVKRQFAFAFWFAPGREHRTRTLFFSGTLTLAAAAIAVVAVSIVAHGSFYIPQNAPYNFYAGDIAFTARALLTNLNGEPSIYPSLLAEGFSPNVDIYDPNLRPYYVQHALLYIRHHPLQALKLVLLKLGTLLRPDTKIYPLVSASGAVKALLALAVPCWINYSGCFPPPSLGPGGLAVRSVRGGLMLDHSYSPTPTRASAFLWTFWS